MAETERFLQATGRNPLMVWHNSSELPEAELYVIPGGFSYGDYLRAGKLASMSPVLKELKQKSAEGRKILGICNGFQILCEAGFLPGTLRINASGLFVCTTVTVMSKNSSYILPIAHGEGNYYDPHPDSVNVALRYKKNPNGSVNDIAGVYNERGNILGMMPHPERAFEDFHASRDGFRLLRHFLDGRIKNE